MSELDSYNRNPLDSRQLRAFLMLSRKGSFTLAAKELHLTQSAISHAMKALEQDVGCRLLDKVGKKILLTQAGEQFRERVEKIFSEMRIARSELNKLGEWGQGRLRIGASAAACQYILPSIISELKTEFPKCSLSINPEDTHGIVTALRGNFIDIGLTLEPEREPDFNFTPLFEDELMFLVNPEHPWAKQRRAKRSSISKQQYILYFKNSRTFELIENYFKSEEKIIKSIIDMGSMSAIKELVKIGLGITILPPWVAKKELDKKQLIALPLGRKKLKRKWGLLYWKNKPKSWAEETFIGLSKNKGIAFAARNGLRSYS
tara:strand:- start:60 stop:1013 length:954 start_codon:yes stop_codon:yes gene_type:complete